MTQKHHYTCSRKEKRRTTKAKIVLTNEDRCYLGGSVIIRSSGAVHKGLSTCSPLHRIAIFKIATFGPRSLDCVCQIATTSFKIQLMILHTMRREKKQTLKIIKTADYTIIHSFFCRNFMMQTMI